VRWKEAHAKNHDKSQHGDGHFSSGFDLKDGKENTKQIQATNHKIFKFYSHLPYGRALHLARHRSGTDNQMARNECIKYCNYEQWDGIVDEKSGQNHQFGIGKAPLFWKWIAKAKRPLGCDVFYLNGIEIMAPN
jgi:hypothetical protein